MERNLDRRMPTGQDVTAGDPHKEISEISPCSKLL